MENVHHTITRMPGSGKKTLAKKIKYRHMDVDGRWVALHFHYVQVHGMRWICARTACDLLEFNVSMWVHVVCSPQAHRLSNRFTALIAFQLRRLSVMSNDVMRDRNDEKCFEQVHGRKMTKQCLLGTMGKSSHGDSNFDFDANETKHNR